MFMICKKLTTKPTSFPGFSPTCPYRARERVTDHGWVWSHDSRTKLILREDSFASQFSGWFIFTACAMIERNIELLTLLDKLDKEVNNQRRNQKLALSVSLMKPIAKVLHKHGNFVKGKSLYVDIELKVSKYLGW